MAAVLPLRHLLLGLLVVGVWGTNFAIIKAGLGHWPPLLFVALRFLFAFIPAAFFVPRPAVGWRNLALYGVMTGVCQFGVLYVAMNGFISAGLASLVMQTQVFFTIALAMLIAREQVKAVQIVALLLAAAGIMVILGHTDGVTTPLGLGLVMFAALSWSVANMANKAAGMVNMISYVVWSSVLAVPPLLVLSLVFDGWAADMGALRDASMVVWGAVLWQSWANTLFGFAAWGWLLARYPAAAVAPMALLVPVFGLAAAVLTLNEPLPSWKLVAAGLVIGGLALNLFWPALLRTLGRDAERLIP